MQDEEVVLLAKAGHAAAVENLFLRYRNLVEAKARCYFVAGADRDDVIQEGMIGLYKAIRDFKGDRLARFKPFAELCVTRHIITAVKSATRQKHLPLNAYISLSTSVSDALGEALLMDLIPEVPKASNKDLIPINLREAVHGALSELENGVLLCYLDGMSYQEISRELSCHTKCIDNALQRVKKKLGALLADDRSAMQ